MARKVLIVGAGNIGSRHLQGLKTIDTDIEIHVVEPFEPSLSLAKDRWAETKSPHKTFFYKYLPNDLNVIECAIIASTSDTRAESTRQLIKRSKTKNIIFEKVLFQKNDDYQGISKLLKENNINAWVNCTRRVWPVYNKIFETIKSPTPIHLHVSGHLWGLGCNSIHMLDLASYLSGETSYEITHTDIDGKIIESKRPGFYEFSGHFGGRFKNGSTFFIESSITPKIPYTLIIKSEHGSAIVHEDIDFYDLYLNEKWERHKLTIPYQSEITGNIVNDILKNGNCNLTPFEDSAALHIPFLNMLLNHLKNVNYKDLSSCPIT